MDVGDDGDMVFARATPANRQAGGHGWVAFGASGWAQAIVDLAFWIHFYKPILRVEPFDGAIAILLVALTGLVGFISSVAAIVWNQFHRGSTEPQLLAPGQILDQRRSPEA